MNDRDRELVQELERRVEAHRAAGDYDLPWLDDPADPADPPTPVDRFLRTPPGPARAGLRELVDPRPNAGVARRHEADLRLREAIAWLKLALDAERAARESAREDMEEEAARRHERAEGRLGRLEADLGALGHAHGERIHRLEEDRRWLAGLLLRERFAEIAAPGVSALEAAEARVFSQNGEDGILLHLFGLVGVTDRRFVEIGIGDGRECNTANLAINFGWRGLMVDAWPTGVAAARAFYASRPETRETVTILERMVTREGVNEMLAEAGVAGPIDLLSIDIDGNDLWVWEAIGSIDPRVVVMEYNATFGPDRSVSVPYDPAFDRMKRHPSGWYHGASITALARVGARKGYVLAGCDSNGVNAFFVRSDCAAGAVDATTPAEAWRPIRERGPRGTAEQFAVIAGLPLEQVP